MHNKCILQFVNTKRPSDVIKKSVIHLHDFGGHGFPAELSRELASLNFQICHCFSGDYVSGKGNISLAQTDPVNLEFVKIETGTNFNKHSFMNRICYELLYAFKLRAHLREKKYDFLILCNTPPIISFFVSLFVTKNSLITWHQDIWSLAVIDELRRRKLFFSSKLLKILSFPEYISLKKSIAIVAISEDFKDFYSLLKLSTESIFYVENWAPTNLIFPEKRNNEWSRTNLTKNGARRILYSGTLGHKHDFNLLVDLMDNLNLNQNGYVLTIISEGASVTALQEIIKDRDDFIFLSFQNYSQLSQAFSAHDFCLTILSSEAAKYSVPSKVLSYLAAGAYPIAIMDPANRASQIIVEVGGKVVPLTESAAHDLASAIDTVSSGELAKVKTNARNYALKHFNIKKKAKVFVEIFELNSKGDE